MTTANGILGSEQNPMNPDEASKFVDYVSKMNRTPFLVGPPGIGKTECIFQMGKRLGLPVVVRLLSQLDPSDFVGLPHIFQDAQGRTRTKFAIPDSFSFDTPHVLFLDEFAQADIAVQRAASELVHEKTFGGIPLASGTRVVAASNRKQDRAGVSEVLGHMKSRMITSHVGVSAPQWLAYASGAGVDQTVMAYITTKHDALLKVDHKAYSYPSPRTWMMVSDALTEARKDAALKAMLPSIVTGAVGAIEGASFLQFMETFEERPTMDEILCKPNTAKIPSKHPDQVQVAHMILSNLQGSAAAAGGFDASCEYMHRLGREAVQAAMRKASNDAIKNGNADHANLILKARNHLDTMA